MGLRADRAPDAALIGPTCETDAVPTRAIDLTGPLDLRATLGIHLRGTGDLTMRLGADAVIRSTRTPDGPATIRIAAGGVRLEAEAWGPGADRALDGLPALVGLDDDRSGFEPGHHPLVAELDRRHRGVRLGRTGAVLESLIPAILEQKVTGREARRKGRTHVS